MDFTPSSPCTPAIPVRSVRRARVGKKAIPIYQNEIARAEKLVLDWRSRVAAFESEFYKIGLVSGEYSLVHGYSGDVYQTWTRNPGVHFAVPSEGAMISTDEFCIASGAALPELAQEFIRFQAVPEVAIDNEKFTGFQRADGTTEGSQVPGSFRPDLSACEVIADLGDALPIWTDAWNRIRMD